MEVFLYPDLANSGVVSKQEKTGNRWDFDALG
jgi:hypothetical protein